MREGRGRRAVRLRPLSVPAGRGDVRLRSGRIERDAVMVEAQPPGEVSAGDSLRHLLSRGLGALYRFIYCRVGSNQQVAEDLLQQTAFIALQHARTPQTADEQEAWLRGIARNLIRRHWRLTKRAANCADPAVAGELLRRVSEATAPEEAATRQEAIDQLSLAVSTLTADEQRLLYDFYRNGRTRAEIAEELGVTAKSVEARLYRVRARLRALLSDVEGAV